MIRREISHRMRPWTDVSGFCAKEPGRGGEPGKGKEKKKNRSSQKKGKERSEEIQRRNRDELTRPEKERSGRLPETTGENPSTNKNQGDRGGRNFSYLQRAGMYSHSRNSKGRRQVNSSASGKKVFGVLTRLSHPRKKKNVQSDTMLTNS